MSAIQLGSFVEQAKRRYPRSADRIRGNGQHVLLSKCTGIWTVLLFDNREDRENLYARWMNSQCLAGYRCQGCLGHLLEEL